ncbi:MAG: AAA family ATPase [Gammaproteobacteria bacterium]|nr:AAA family ATPase [Gammaproteobacteria bacterium]
MLFNIKNMLNPDAYQHPTKNIELIETHISWVLLTGDFAYKIKKPVNYGFLDFSTLEKRHDFCNRELELNRRLAPSIYLDVVPITGTHDKVIISNSVTDSTNVIEYAVKMTQFPQSAQLDHMLAADKLNTKHFDAIAHMVAEFHQTIKVSDDSLSYGDNDAVYQPVEENFTQINENLDTAIYADKLNTLSRWCSNEFLTLKTIFEKRKNDGFIRECHGDMHLRNLIWLNDKPIAFDCIEFNPKLRWIDVISEVAFLVMDLQDRKQYILANHFLNTYLELTGDYDGLSILPFYLCYRALVRAKVNTLRLKQKNLSSEEREITTTEFESYLELAVTYTQQSTPKLIIMRGLSASGKSTVSQQLIDVTGTIRIRSDVERKRLFKIAPTNNISEKVDNGIYSSDASQRTYKKLLELASMIINSGYSVIVDAAFLQQEQREPFQKLAKQLKTPYIILEITAPTEILRQRIMQRKNDVSDADLAVLEHQLSNWQPLHEGEKKAVIPVDTTGPFDLPCLIKKLMKNNLIQEKRNNMKTKVTDAVDHLNKILPLAERQKGLDAETANVYQMILKSYVELGRTLNKAEIAKHVTDIEEVINTLRSNDMVVFDSNDEPVGAYPFTMEQRDHRIKINSNTVHSMCALDALAISPMFNIETHIDSKCHVTGDSISIDQLDQEVLNKQENQEVHFGINWSSAANNCCATSLCTEMIFLKDKKIAESWFAEDKENREIFDLRDAIDFATHFFKPLVS